MGDNLAEGGAQGKGPQAGGEGNDALRHREALPQFDRGAGQQADAARNPEVHAQPSPEPGPRAEPARGPEAGAGAQPLPGREAAPQTDAARCREAHPQPAPQPDAQAEAVLRWLKRLVTGLAVVMGVGILAIALVLWVRLGPGAAPQGAIPALPARIALPEGVRAQAVTFARDWTVVVTDSGEVLLYDRDGALRQRVAPQP